MYQYHWLRYGLEIETPTGTIFLQGEEAAALYDMLEECETEEQVENICSEYEACAK